MELIRTIAVVAGLGLLANGYITLKHPDSPTPVTPDNKPSVKADAVITINSAADAIPAAPSNQQIASASAPIRQLLAGNKDDALKLARTFKGWSQLLATSPPIKTTTEFQQAYIQAMQILLSRHSMAGKYALNQPIDATFLAAFGSVGLTDGNQVKAADWSPQATQAAIQAFDALSYQCYQAFIDSQVNRPAPSNTSFSPGNNSPSHNLKNYSSERWKHYTDDEGRIFFKPVSLIPTQYQK